MSAAEKQLRLTLNNGALMSAVATGTAPLKEFTTEFILKAIELGYRHFDTAKTYGPSEHILGEGLQEAFKQGLVKREDVFITTKLSPGDMNPPDVIPALKNSLSALQLDYVDMYLIHWPVSLRPGSSWWQLTAEDYLPLDIPGCWKALEKCVELGLTKGIGVSNFSVKNLKALESHAKILPAVNQVERHPGYDRTAIVNHCKKSGTVVTGYAALGAPGYGALPLGTYGTNGVIENPILKEVGAKYGKTSAQIALRWALERGCGVVVKSVNPGRMAQNIDLFDFTLRDEDMETIDSMPHHRVEDGHWYVGPGSPYTTVEDLWADE
ncbi:hypothetical protein R1sor_000995 [Riccia sorocarpa]|uniref:NADP-dependent oxidoreductase domain-containing protein n=1 Tax=Riccia sorocarpa TaxID=122646 RepID=A0ABD3GVK4_9MARC